MNDVVLVQWYPIVKRVGRYAFCNKSDNNFFHQFQDEVRASDFNCQSIIMILESNEYAGIISTPNQIQQRIEEYFATMYQDYQDYGD